MSSAAPPADIRLVRTDIAGFVGFAERGPVAGEAVKLTSWKEFRLIFGGFLPDAYLAYAMRGFFANGGTTCYVVRVASTVPGAGPVSASLPLPAAQPPRLITFLAGPVERGHKELKLDSADVLSVGDLIQVGPPDDFECFSVTAVADEQTIKVAPQPEAKRAAGTPVYSLTGSSLAHGATAGETSIQVLDATTFRPGDLVGIEGEGIEETRLVTDSPGGGTLRLGRALLFDYGPGDAVRKYAAAVTVRAFSPGEWGNRIRLKLTPLEAGPAVTEFSLEVTVDAGRDTGQSVEREFYPHLSLDPATRKAPIPVFAPDVIENASQLIRLEASDPAAALWFASGPLHRGDTSLQGGFDGAARGEITDDDFRSALAGLAAVDEIAIIAAPDLMSTGTPAPPPAPKPPPPDPCNGAAAATPPRASVARVPPLRQWNPGVIQSAMLEQCARLRYRVAVLDPPAALQPAKAAQWLDDQAFDDRAAKFAAVYYPWLKVPDELALTGPNRTVPPCGHIAGAYAFTDNLSGPQKPPANVELNFVADVEQDVSREQQGALNERGVNAIRSFPGRGIRVWGARSVSRDPAWRYIHTRRLLSMIEDSVEKASQWTVFETHNEDLRRTLTHSLNVFLEGFWRSGGLKGARPEDSFYVKCDATNNPQPSIDAGLLICRVGVAIAAPMEFIVFEMHRSVAGPQVVEA